MGAIVRTEGQGFAELFRRCVGRRGAEAWAELVRRYDRRMRRIVRQRVSAAGLRPREDLVEELLQELYVKLLRARVPDRRFDGRSDRELWGYVVRIVRSLVIDYRRAAGAGKRGGEAFGGRGESVDGVEAIGIAHGEPSPEERLLRKEGRRVFIERCRGAVAGRCPEVQVETLRLAVLEGWSSRDVARRLGVSRAAVDTTVHRLRARLAREGIRLPRRGSGWRRRR